MPHYYGGHFKFKKPNPRLVEKGTPMLNLPFALSASKITEWYQCPTKFYATYLTKEVKFKDTPQTLEGKEKHTALEQYGRTGIISDILSKSEYQLVEKIRAVENATVLYESDGIFGFTSIDFKEAIPLQQMWDKMPNGENFFLIGCADLICVTGETAVIVDHKNGKQKKTWEKNYESDKLRNNVENGWIQLQLYAIQTFLRFPQVNKVKCIFNYLKDNVQIHKIYSRHELPALQLTAKQTCEHILADYATFVNFQDNYTRISPYKELIQAHSESYGRSSGLCNWCGYRDKCIKYNKCLPDSQRGYDKAHPANGINVPREPIQQDLLTI